MNFVSLKIDFRAISNSTNFADTLKFPWWFVCVLPFLRNKTSVIVKISTLSHRLLSSSMTFVLQFTSNSLLFVDLYLLLFYLMDVWNAWTVVNEKKKRSDLMSKCVKCVHFMLIIFKETSTLWIKRVIRLSQGFNFSVRIHF